VQAKFKKKDKKGSKKRKKIDKSAMVINDIINQNKKNFKKIDGNTIK